MSAFDVRRVLPFFLVLLLGLPATALTAQTVRGHGGTVHRGGGHSGHVHSGSHVGVSVGFGYGYGGYGYGGYYGYPYYGYYRGGYYGPSYYGYYGPGYYGGYYGAPAYVDRGPGSDAAFLDTDVSPEKTSVYLDGEYVGVADSFDGYPRYLAVEPGSHTLRFEAEGRIPITRRVKVPRGAIVRFDFSLQKGSASGAGQNPGEEIVIPGPPGYSDSNGNGNGNGKSQSKNSYPKGDAESAHMKADADDVGPGLLKLNVSPADASVYIDGEFLGTGTTISRLHGSLRLGSGRHTIEVARPGYRSEKREVRLNGEPLPVDIRLQRN